MTNLNSGVAPGVKAFLDYWENVRGRTRRLVLLIPEDRIEWGPVAGKFGLGDLVRHLAAIERDMYAETVRGRPSRYQGCGRDRAEGLAEVVAFFDRLHAESMALFRELTDEALERKCMTPAGNPMATWKWLRAMIEHEAHHRGQIYLMLGMLGVPTPPLYGLTAEEVAARSIGV